MPSYPQTATLDDRDRAIIAQRAAALDRQPGVRVGDFVDFADGVTRRVSHVWDDSIQTSDGGSWHLAGGRSGMLRTDDRASVSFSGGLFPGVKPETLMLTDERRDGGVWIFHHDLWRAHNGVESSIPFRVFRSTENAPR